MEAQKTLKVGDLVTVDYGLGSTASNTYKIYAKLDGKSVLSHPLAPECYIIKADTELNTAMPNLPNPTEKCLFFCNKNRSYLDFNSSAELEALGLYFILKKDLTSRQKAGLANLCGRVAKYKFQHSVERAANLVSSHEALLDEFNAMWFQRLRKTFKNPKSITKKEQQIPVFNMAGFVLSQLETTEAAI